MRPVEVNGELVLTIESHEFAVQAKQDSITLVLPHWRTGVRLWRLSAELHKHMGFLTPLQNALSSAQLTFDICLAGRVIARLGACARPNLSARLLKLAPIELRPFMLGWSCLQRSN